MTRAVDPDRVERRIRIRGRVQGVGFRPTVFRIATELALDGDVRNDADGVTVRVAGAADAIDRFLARLERDRPPLARIDAIEATTIVEAIAPGFCVVPSEEGSPRTEIAPDARMCETCARELFDPEDRRCGYPFLTCTHCGPRLTIVTGAPYDRERTTMARFPLCVACAGEYGDPRDRRFHAEPIACPACGPHLRFAGGGVRDLDGVAAAIAGGAIVALKGLGGFQLVCDATNERAITTLRARKRRDAKPFALMARDVSVVRRYASVSTLEARLLASAEGPIVLLEASGAPLPDAVAPGLGTLGFMLPTTPLHALLLARSTTPVVATSANLSDAPPIIDDDAALDALAEVADVFVLHDRPIASRVDDSVVRVMDGEMRVLRRARGFAPSRLALPPGLEDAPSILACGAELKGTFCLVTGGALVLSPHQGDLGDAATFDDYRKNVALFTAMFAHAPSHVAHDQHPDYVSTHFARGCGLPTIAIQHHHAHVAACLAEEGRPLGTRVLGVVLDGVGFGDDATAWGGELLVADYRAATRVGGLVPVAMIGGDVAAREPWRNLVAHLQRAGLPLPASLAGAPVAAALAMLRADVNVPRASSCGRLFDAFAALLEVRPHRQAYEGEAATMLEALAAHGDGAPYPFALARTGAGLQIDPAPMWRTAVDDRARGTAPAAMAASFHRGLADALARAAAELCAEYTISRVVLSGGCFQNRVLFEATTAAMGRAGLSVSTHREIPPNDGGIALGQAVIAAARLVRG